MRKDNITILNMDTNFIKLVALITMLIDHVGLIFFPSNPLFRMIGRIAFPLYCYCILIGYFKTRDLKMYFVRLFVIGIISQPVYMVLFNVIRTNIFFTLMSLLLLYYSLDNKKWYLLPFLVVVPFILKFEYSIIYLFLGIIYFYCRNNKFLLILMFSIFYGNYLLDYSIVNLINSCGILSLPFMLIKTNFNLKINKFVYYLFYPIHILVLLVISLYI